MLSVFLIVAVVYFVSAAICMFFRPYLFYTIVGNIFENYNEYLFDERIKNAYSLLFLILSILCAFISILI